jgi:hypothetical protein
MAFILILFSNFYYVLDILYSISEHENQLIVIYVIIVSFRYLSLYLFSRLFSIYLDLCLFK